MDKKDYYSHELEESGTADTVTMDIAIVMLIKLSKLNGADNLVI
jgi:hypothetical protein